MEYTPADGVLEIIESVRMDGNATNYGKRVRGEGKDFLVL